jgi:hypothetical protein
LKQFVECINTGKTSISDGHAGLRIVKMLEAAEKSAKNRGELVYLNDVEKSVATVVGRS